MRKAPQLLTGIAVIAGLSLYACNGGGGTDAKKPAKAQKADKGDKGDKGDKKAAAEIAAPVPAAEPITGEPVPTLLLSQAWFWKDAQGRPKPGPARLQIWRQTAEGWMASRLEDGDSNVFHKSILRGDHLLTIGAEGAILKKWTWQGGTWKGEELWKNSWGGKFNRLRDIEIGDVDGDGKDEWVIATHDSGVIAVYNPPEGDTPAETIELDQKADTFVHEIEIGDIDGDGKLEFFATPSDRNLANKSQHGEVVMYRFDGAKYVRSVVDPGENTHAKEVLAVDMDGDGKSELFSVQEAQTDAAKKVIKPVEVRQYALQPDGSFTMSTVATIDDRQTRFLVPGDFDGDGFTELVAASMKTGAYLIDSEDKGATWTIDRFDAVSSGFEHAAYAADLDGNGTPELYIAADDQRELKRYIWNAEKKSFDRTLLGRLEENTITWNIEAGKM